MTIKNTSAKPLSIDGKIIMPNGKASVGAEYAKNPIILKYIELGIIRK
jgi:hypothetical protein